MSANGKLETTIAGEAAAILQKIASLAIRDLTFHPMSKGVDEIDVYNDYKRRATDPGVKSTLPADWHGGLLRK